MLTHSELVNLYRSLEDRDVLSVYVDADQHDPAARDAWRTRLQGEVARLRREVADGGGEANAEAALDAAWGRIRDRVRDVEERFLPGRGLVAFATPEKLAYMEFLPISTRTLVRWEKGLAAAPYVRALKQERTVAVALVDRERARFFIYREAELREREGVRADTAVGDLTDVGAPKRASRVSGRRGETSTDQAHRILEVSAERMLKDVAEGLERYAGAHGFLVLGGTKEVTSRVVDTLSADAAERTIEIPSLHVDMDREALRDAVRGAASELTEAWQARAVSDVLDAARSGGLGSAGREETARALREMRVDALLLSRSFVREDPDFADRYLGTAFAQRAHVEEVGGAPGQRLTREAEGVAARLRYRVRRSAVGVGEGSPRDDG